MRRGVYPGSFNPPTLGHLAVMEAAVTQRCLERLDLVVSRRPLGKGIAVEPRIEDRVAVLAESVAHLSMIEVVVTDAQLLADIAGDYDVVVMGADKWTQIHQLEFYGGSAAARDAAMTSLPELAIAPRPPFRVPPEHLLTIDTTHADTSSSRARSGDLSLMTAAARRFAERHGVWGSAATPRSSRPEQ